MIELEIPARSPLRSMASSLHRSILSLLGEKQFDPIDEEVINHLDQQQLHAYIIKKFFRSQKNLVETFLVFSYLKTVHILAKVVRYAKHIIRPIA